MLVSRYTLGPHSLLRKQYTSVFDIIDAYSSVFNARSEMHFQNWFLCEICTKFEGKITMLGRSVKAAFFFRDRYFSRMSLLNMNSVVSWCTRICRNLYWAMCTIMLDGIGEDLWAVLNLIPNENILRIWLIEVKRTEKLQHRSHIYFL